MFRAMRHGRAEKADAISLERRKFYICLGLWLAAQGLFGLIARLFGAAMPAAAWLLPVLGAAAAFYLSAWRKSQTLALLGYAGAIGLPLFTGAFEYWPGLRLPFALAFCLPLPFIIKRAGWRCLPLCVLACFIALCRPVFAAATPEALWSARFFLLAFSVLYLADYALLLRRADFDPNRLPDFLLSLGISLAVALLHLSLALALEEGLALALAAPALALAGLCLETKRRQGDKGQRLVGAYFLLAFGMSNAALHFLLEHTALIALYALEGIFLFGLAGRRGWWRLKALVLVFVLCIPLYCVFTQGRITDAFCVAGAALGCAFLQDRETRRQGRHYGRRGWSSWQEALLLILGFAGFFGGMAVFIFTHVTLPGQTLLLVLSACAYFFYSLGRLIRFRALNLAIFLPILISLPALLLPLAYQAQAEWPAFEHLFSYNYFSGLGGAAWAACFIAIWTALRHCQGGLISKEAHAWLIGLAILGLMLALTSSCRAFALEWGVAPSLLSVLAVLPSLICVIFLSHLPHGLRPLTQPYRRVILLAAPGALFMALAVWFFFSLSSPGRDAPGGNYMPLLNPVELSQLACIAVFSYWQRRLRKARMPAPHLSGGKRIWVYGIFSFLWLHGLMFRVLQYFSQAGAREVFSFVELQFMFACIWVMFGIVLWLGATRYASSLSWCLGFLLLGAGSIFLEFISFRLWGRLPATLLALGGIVLLILLLWRSPAPFTARGRKLGGALP